MEILKPQGFKEEQGSDALIAQWIERLVADQKVAGPIPAKRTKRANLYGASAAPGCEISFNRDRWTVPCKRRFTSKVRFLSRTKLCFGVGPPKRTD